MFDPEVALAAAVVERAFIDLTAKPTKKMKPDAAYRVVLAQRDAKQFLLVDLWEPDSLWGAWLGLNEEAVKEEVMRRLG